MLIAFPLHQWLQEHTPVLRYTYIVCPASVPGEPDYHSQKISSLIRFENVPFYYYLPTFRHTVLSLTSRSITTDLLGPQNSPLIYFYYPVTLSTMVYIIIKYVEKYSNRQNIKTCIIINQTERHSIKTRIKSGTKFSQYASDLRKIFWIIIIRNL